MISDLVPSGYEFQHVPRANLKRGGSKDIMNRSGLCSGVSETNDVYAKFCHISSLP